MVWAWNLVRGCFINFRNGRKILTLLTFGCPSYHQSQKTTNTNYRVIDFKQLLWMNQSCKHCKLYVALTVRNCWPILLDYKFYQAYFILKGFLLINLSCRVFSCLGTFLESWVYRVFLSVLFRINSSGFAVEPLRHRPAVLCLHNFAMILTARVHSPHFSNKTPQGWDS